MKNRHPNINNFCYLLFSGIFLQGLGMVYRLWLAGRIGADGLGLFQIAYSVYRLLAGIATIGLPLALTKWVAEFLSDKKEKKIIALRQWAISTIRKTSIGMAFILLISAKVTAEHIFAEPRAAALFVILTVALPFSAASSIYRGYFQGFSQMAPSAVSEITEQSVEWLFTFTVLSLFVKLNDIAYLFPVIGLTLGEIACFLTLRNYVKKQSDFRTNKLEKREQLPHKDIFDYSRPLLFNQITATVGNASESALIPHLLVNCGYSGIEATRALGLLNGMAIPLAVVPLLFLMPLTAVLSPQISQRAKNPNPAFRKKIALYYWVASIFSIIGAINLFIFAPRLTEILYQSTETAPLIRILAIFLPFCAVTSLNLTILSSLGFSNKVFSLSLWTLGVKTTSLFCFIPFFGLKGAALSSLSAHIFIFLASLPEILRYTNVLGAKNLPTKQPPYCCPKERP